MFTDLSNTVEESEEQEGALENKRALGKEERKKERKKEERKKERKFLICRI